MAKIGEGDPRWLVENRADGTNVGNWHWTEKDFSSWGKDQLKKAFENKVIEDSSEHKVETLSFEELNVDMSINARKGKIFYFFEIDFKLKWQAESKKATGDKKITHKGTINLPGLSEENEDDIEVSVSRDGNSNQSEVFRKGIHTVYVPQVKVELQNLLKEFRAKTPPIKPTTTTTPATTNPTPLPAPVAATPSLPPVTVPKSTTVSKRTVRLQSFFGAPPDVLFRNLLDQGCVSAFTQSSCTIDARPFGRFSLLGGTISGEFVEIKSPEKIVEKWRFKDWDASIVSTVTLKFVQGKTESSETPGTGSGCTIFLEQSGVPSPDTERVLTGWEQYIFSPLRIMMGYGSIPF